MVLRADLALKGVVWVLGLGPVLWTGMPLALLLAFRLPRLSLRVPQLRIGRPAGAPVQVTEEA